MSDTLGAAAPEISTAPDAPVDAPIVDTPNPISTADEGHVEPDKADPKADKPKSNTETKPLTTREALQKAAEKVEKDSKEADPKAKVETKETKPDKSEPVKTDGPVKDKETGKFVSKDPDKAVKTEPPKPSYTAGEAPTRFTADVKAAWASLPENVRGEVSRMERELTQGYEKHKASAEAFESYRNLEEIAKQSGKKGADVFREYYNTEQLLRKDLVGGLDTICQRLGVSLKDVAAHVMGQTPEQNASAQDATIRELKQTIQQLEQKVGSVAKTFQKQQETAVGKEVADFAAAHPRFEELQEDIAFFLKTRTPDLSEAYKLAERINPAPAVASKPEVSSAPAIDLSVQTEKGQKSINGSPSPGSNPAAQRPSNSIKESLKRAMAQAG